MMKEETKEKEKSVPIFQHAHQAKDVSLWNDGSYY